IVTLDSALTVRQCAGRGERNGPALCNQPGPWVTLDYGVQPMSETTNQVPVTQEQEQNQAQAPASTPAEQSPAETNEPNEGQQLKEAERIRKECGKSYRAGEREYRKGLLEAGRLAHSYLCIRMSLGHSREAAVKTLEGDLSAYSSQPVDVSRLVR